MSNKEMVPSSVWLIYGSFVEQGKYFFESGRVSLIFKVTKIKIKTLYIDKHNSVKIIDF